MKCNTRWKNSDGAQVLGPSHTIYVHDMHLFTEGINSNYNGDEIE